MAADEVAMTVLASRLALVLQARCDLPPDAFAVELAHHGSLTSTQWPTLWSGFRSAQLRVLAALARRQTVKPILVLGAHPAAAVCAQAFPASILQFAGVQYLPFSAVNTSRLTRSLATAAAASTHTAHLPLPAGFQRSSMETLRVGLSGLAHDIENRLRTLDTLVDRLRRPTPLPNNYEISDLATPTLRREIALLADCGDLVGLSAGDVDALMTPIRRWYQTADAWAELIATIRSNGASSEIRSEELTARCAALLTNLHSIDDAIKRLDVQLAKWTLGVGEPRLGSPLQ